MMATTPRKTAAVQPDTGTGTYTVLDSLHHDGRLYGQFERVELTQAQAAALPASVISGPEKTAETAGQE